MSRAARRIAAFRPVREVYRGVRWSRANRLWHEKNKRTDPRFSAACKLTWTHILKRPDTRYGDGRQQAIAARPLPNGRRVYFLAYVKRSGYLHIISIRYAEDDEIDLHYRCYP